MPRIRYAILDSNAISLFSAFGAVPFQLSDGTWVLQADTYYSTYGTIQAAVQTMNDEQWDWYQNLNVNLLYWSTEGEFWYNF